MLRPFVKEDLGWVWAAYTMGSFGFPRELSQEELTARVLNGLSGLVTFIVEDDNKKFKNGRGPVGMVSMATDGFLVEPNVAIFKWATKKNILRGFVAFFQWVKFSKDIGVCEFRVPSSRARILTRMKDYGVLYPKRNEILFRVAGRKPRKRAEA